MSSSDGVKGVDRVHGSPLEQVREALRLVQETRRTLVVSADQEDEVRSLVEAQGFAGLVKVIGSQYVEQGKAYTFKEPTL